jgi:hypothetical protein
MIQVKFKVPNIAYVVRGFDWSNWSCYQLSALCYNMGEPVHIIWRVIFESVYFWKELRLSIVIVMVSILDYYEQVITINKSRGSKLHQI